MRTGIVVGVLAALVGLILIAGSGDEGGPNPYVVIGVVTGVSYSLIALALVLVYKGTRVFNFAQGEFGTMAAFIVFVLLEQVKSPSIPYGVAVVIALAGVTLLGLGMERVLVRPLLNAPRITLLVGTIAVSLLLVGVELILFLPDVKNLPSLVEPLGPGNEPRGFEIYSYIIEPQNLVIIGVLVALGILMAYFFSRTDLGLAVLATSQDQFATRVVGIGVERMSRFIWGTAAFLGALAGILYIPTATPLAPGVMTTGVLIPSFTAAVIGGMTSLPGAFVGGIALGLIQQLAGWAAGHYHLGDELWSDVVPGFPEVAIFATLLLVLLVRPQGMLGAEA